MGKVILGLAGVLFGAFAGGGVDVFASIVLPHGGWSHVSSGMIFRLVSGTVGGCILGVVAGALIDVGIRRRDARFHRAGSLIVLGQLWACVSTFVLDNQAPMFLHYLNATPYFLLAAFFVAWRKAGRAGAIFWPAALSTLLYSLWLHLFAYRVWLQGSIRDFSLSLRLSARDRELSGMQESHAFDALFWPLVGVGIAAAWIAFAIFWDRHRAASAVTPKESGSTPLPS